MSARATMLVKGWEGTEARRGEQEVSSCTLRLRSRGEKRKLKTHEPWQRMRPKRGQGAREARACWWLERLTREECLGKSAELLGAGRTFARRAKSKQRAELEARKAVGWWLGVVRRNSGHARRTRTLSQIFFEGPRVKGQEEDQMVRGRRKGTSESALESSTGAFLRAQGGRGD